MVNVTAAPEIEDASDGDGEPLFVNKGELAQKILGCSVITVNALIAKYPDFPIERRGTNGVQWRFDAAAVTKFIQEKRSTSERAGASREALFDQLRLTLDEMDTPEAAGLSPAQRLALAKAIQIEMKNGVEAGKLLKIETVEDDLHWIITNVTRFLDSLPARMGRQLGLSNDTVWALRRSLDEAREMFHRDIQRKFGHLDADALEASPTALANDPSGAPSPGAVASGQLDGTWADAESADPAEAR